MMRILPTMPLDTDAKVYVLADPERACDVCGRVPAATIHPEVA